MPNELNQEEIDALARAARSAGKAEGGGREPKVELWDVRRAGQIGREQLQAITHLHEAFARNLTTVLGTYLRVAFYAALVSAEHLTYREFLERIPETTYLASCELRPLGGHGALQLDLKVAFPIIDLLLGGEGKGIAATREITEIEQQIVESVAGIVCRELGAAWQAIHLEVELERRIAVAEAQGLMPANEKVLSLSFEVGLLDVRGGLNLAVPVTLSHAWLRQIAGESRETRPRGPAEWQARLQRRLLECPFPVDLGASGLSATYGELSRLEVGGLLPLRRSAAEPASLIVGGVEMFAALPARSGETRVAQLLARPQGSPQGEDETGGNPEGQKR